MSNFRELISAALKTTKMTPTELRLPGPHSNDFPIFAMSHFQLGEIDKSHEYQEKFDTAMTSKALKDNKECQSFAQEVETLFQKQKPAEGPEDAQ